MASRKHMFTMGASHGAFGMSCLDNKPCKSIKLKLIIYLHTNEVCGTEFNDKSINS